MTNFILKYLSTVPIPILFALSISITVAGDYFAKSWSLQPQKISLYWVGMISWFIANAFYTPSLLKKQLVTAGLIFSLGNILGYSMIGILIFKESINTTQMFGIFFGLVAIILLGLS